MWDENFSRTSIIHFFSYRPLVTVTQWWSMIKSSTYIRAGYLWRENPLLKCQLLHDLFHFSSSFLLSRLMQSCVKISNTLISTVTRRRRRGGWNFTMRNERRRSLIDKRKSCVTCHILIVNPPLPLYVWKLKYQKFIKKMLIFQSGKFSLFMCQLCLYVWQARHIDSWFFFLWK